MVRQAGCFTVALAAAVAGAQSWGAPPLSDAPGARPAAPRPAAPRGGAPRRLGTPDRRIGFDLVHVRPGRSLRLRDAPAGDIDATIGASTAFGSPTVLPVLGRSGPWLGVPATELGNGRLGWIRHEDPALRLTRTAISLHVSLSRRSLVVRRGVRVIRRIRVTVGGRSSPTPPGQFAVTDRLAGARFSPTYGCCILALSGRQPNLPAGWPGGDRLAVHAGEMSSTIGRAASAGCLRGTDGDLRLLMRAVPLGAPVFVRGRG